MRLVLIMTCLVVSATRRSEAAAILLPGDIVTADYREVVRVNPYTGEQIRISAGGMLVGVHGIAVEPSGSLIVTQESGLDFNGGGVIRIDPATGSQTVLASTGPGRAWRQAVRVITSPAGDIIFTDYAGGTKAGSIVSMHPTTTAEKVLSQKNYLVGPNGLAWERSGHIVVTIQPGPISDVLPAVVRIDPTSGAQSVVTRGGYLDSPNSVAVDRTGSIYVADWGAFGGSGGVVRIDPIDGSQERVPIPPTATHPIAVAFDDGGRMLVGGADYLYRVDLSSGVGQLLTTGIVAHSIVIFPEPGALIAFGCLPFLLTRGRTGRAKDHARGRVTMICR